MEKEKIYANCKVMINGKAYAYCTKREDAENRCAIFRRQGFYPTIIYAPGCREDSGPK